MMMIGNERETDQKIKHINTLLKIQGRICAAIAVKILDFPAMY